MISQGHITHCLRCQGDSVLIFMSGMGSLETNVSGGERRQGDKSTISCSNLQRSEARLLRSRTQVGKRPGPQRRHIYLGRSGAGDRTQPQCSQPSSTWVHEGAYPSVGM